MIYFDEWNSGVNFNKICKLLSASLNKLVQFFPVAVLNGGAEKAPRYSSFCEDHDQTVPSAAGPGNQFRYVLPQLDSRVPIPHYFFWAEKDRLAGVRKLQIHGSMFSTLDHTIQQLNTDPSALKEAVCICLAIAAQNRKLPTSSRSAIEAMKTIFREAYADYQECRQQLEECADPHHSALNLPRSLSSLFILERQ